MFAALQIILLSASEEMENSNQVAYLYSSSGLQFTGIPHVHCEVYLYYMD